VGYDQERPLGESEEGAKTALPIWMNFMREALRGVPERRRPMPDGLIQLRISPDSGMLVSGENRDAISEIFMVDHLPTGGTPGEEGTTPASVEGAASAEPIF
jgi:penicillin-binding protein 1A